MVLNIAIQAITPPYLWLFAQQSRTCFAKTCGSIAFSTPVLVTPPCVRRRVSCAPNAAPGGSGNSNPLGSPGRIERSCLSSRVISRLWVFFPLSVNGSEHFCAINVLFDVGKQHVSCFLRIRLPEKGRQSFFIPKLRNLSHPTPHSSLSSKRENCQ